MFFGDGTAPSGVRHYVVPIRNGQVAEEPLPERCVRELSGEARERAERRTRRIRDAQPAWDICLLAETGSGGCGVGGALALEERGTIGSSQTSGGASDVVAAPGRPRAGAGDAAAARARRPRSRRPRRPHADAGGPGAWHHPQRRACSAEPSPSAATRGGNRPRPGGDLCLTSRTPLASRQPLRSICAGMSGSQQHVAGRSWAP
jgi:hypothetical protein